LILIAAVISLIEGKIVPAVSILWATYRPKFRRGYRYGLAYRFVVMGKGLYRS